ncbi:MAG: hypothetical protein OCU22_09320 [Canidatus Methanoxibalbensis ujae]|nr:hypothetical protein [Candidatus Methanoxibalbensis ujae]
MSAREGVTGRDREGKKTIDKVVYVATFDYQPDATPRLLTASKYKRFPNRNIQDQWNEPNHCEGVCPNCGRTLVFKIKADDSGTEKVKCYLCGCECDVDEVVRASMR